MFTISENFRVLLKEVNDKTYIAFESNGDNFVIYAQAWEKLKPYLYEIDREFIKRCDFKKEQNKVFSIVDDFKITVGENKTNTYVNIELGDSVIKLDCERWKRFQDIFPTISETFAERYSK